MFALIGGLASAGASLFLGTQQLKLAKTQLSFEQTLANDAIVSFNSLLLLGALAVGAYSIAKALNS